MLIALLVAVTFLVLVVSIMGILILVAYSGAEVVAYSGRGGNSAEFRKFFSQYWKYARKNFLMWAFSSAVSGLVLATISNL